MKIIGLLGGVASGKSFVAQAFVRRGAVWLDADKAGHEVLREADVVQAILKRWGSAVLKDDGRMQKDEGSGDVRHGDTETRRRGEKKKEEGREGEGKREEKTSGTELDRSAIAKIVFEDSPRGAAELKWLEQLTHPLIRKRLENQLSELRATNCPLAILDAPVMLKSGWDSICDYVIYVHAPQEVRLSRALARGWTPEQFEKRESAQETLAVKRARADFEVDNSGDSEYTERELDQLWPRLLK